MTTQVHEFNFSADSGTYSITSGAYGFSGASVQALLEDRDLDSAMMELESAAVESAEMADFGAGQLERIVLRDAEGVTFELEAFKPADGHCLVLKLRLVNRSADELRVLALEPLVVGGEGGKLELGGHRGDWTVLREGWESRSQSGVVRLSHASGGGGQVRHLAPELQDLVQGGAVVSDRVTMVHGSDDDSPCLLAGWLDNRKYFGSFIVGHDQLLAVAETDWAVVPPDGVLETSPLVVMLGSYGPPLVEWYGDMFSRRMGGLPLRPGPGGKASEPRAVSGWLSWHNGSAGGITAEYLRRNLQQYQSQADRWRLTTWLIDDGWQSVAGDWLMVSQQRFPQGMKGMAEEIRRAGLEPGLWIAPFIVSQGSMLAREHADWLVRQASGELYHVPDMPADGHWQGRQYVLDVTHPAAAEHIAEVVRTIVRQWGFSLVLADYLHVIASGGVRHDMSLSRCQVMRRGLEILRGAVGERFLLAGGCPLGPAVGLVDGMRTGPDSAERWFDEDVQGAAAGNAVRNTIARYWQHNRLYLNDPGAVMVRQVESSLGLEEIRAVATVAAMSGGLMLWSDVPDSVSEDRRGILDKILPVWPYAARPVDLMMRSAEISTLHWRFTQGESSWDVVAVVNLSARQADIDVSLEVLGLRGQPYHAFEIWQEAYLGQVKRELVVRGVPAHGVRVVALRPAPAGPSAAGAEIPGGPAGPAGLATERLCFLGSTLHLTMDAFFCEVHEHGLACDVRLSNRYPRRGRLFLWAPEGYVVRTTSGQLTSRRDGSWSIEVDTTTVTDYNFEAIRTG